MTKLSEAARADSKYLRAADLPEGAEIELQIRSVRMEQLEGDSKETKPVLYFTGKEKGLVLNKVNAGRLIAALGDKDLHEYVGATVLVYRTTTEFRGDTVDCLRLKVGAQTQPADPGELAF